jgi:hypothetical protein
VRDNDKGCHAKNSEANIDGRLKVKKIFQTDIQSFSEGCIDRSRNCPNCLDGKASAPLQTIVAKFKAQERFESTKVMFNRTPNSQCAQ